MKWNKMENVATRKRHNKETVEPYTKWTDIGPSSMYLVPGSDRYRSISFFYLPY